MHKRVRMPEGTGNIVVFCEPLYSENLTENMAKAPDFKELVEFFGAADRSRLKPNKAPSMRGFFLFTSTSGTAWGSGTFRAVAL